MASIDSTPRVRAWIKPLNEGFQFYARVFPHERVMGSTYDREQAHDIVVDYVAQLAPGFDEWDIDWKDR